MSGFTPGPWEIENVTDVFTQSGAHNAEGITADHDDGWQVADCSVGKTSVDGELSQLSLDECICNARLIAAAPDLYEALTLLVADIDGNEPDPIEQQWLGSPRRKQCIEALAKARGDK